jgi:hypothetical protein
MKRLFIFLVLTIPCLASIADEKSSLRELDNIIAHREEYIQSKESRIALLKQRARTERDSNMLLIIYTDIYTEYHVFKFDSAMCYAEKGYHLALRQNNQGYINRFQLHRAELLSISGLYSEAFDILNSIDSTTVEKGMLFYYYFHYFTFYSYKTSFANDSTYAPRYRAIARQYLEKAISHLSPLIPFYDYYMGEKYVYIDNDPVKAREHYEWVLEKQEDDAREYAMTCYALAGNHAAQGEYDKRMEYLIKASLCDLKCSNMENSALMSIAMTLFEQGDVERAERYINVSMEDAKFYNNRLRILEISRILPQIMTSYQATMEKQNRNLRYSVIFISLLVLGLLCTAYFILRQNRKLTARRQELAGSNQQLQLLNQQLADSNQHQAKLNDQLHDLNQKLVDTNKRREGLASIYIDLCAKYIDKLGKYQTLVKRKIKAHQEQELLQAISSTRISEEDAVTFLNRFDKAFLELYPTFVEEFNALLTEDGRIAQKSPHTLTTELRTFALIRLGVKSTADIAGLLFLSNQTIYNCRSVTKNKAINKETFDDDVMHLCTVIQ